jgi:esterase FrsA
MRALSHVGIAALLWMTGEPASAQISDRTIEEIKAETLARAQTGAYPLLGIQPADAGDALGRISRDPDEWAAAWSAVADGYMVPWEARRLGLNAP